MADRRRGYRRCLECDTTYLTARGLRRAYRMAAWSRFRRGRGTWWQRWRPCLTRARAIRFCPICLHDWP
ncbi:hypothetical protein CSH63_17805 [Micromonospora tulbaghiae]|uniref:Zinc-ribbon domain-containing protein n=1 Tax=Micromonospora tulbaghiae TaxID=479978 RepID=A0A386WLR3_9ACTN|nr:hypothetical protein [Micromonospora tulbaghiae]AYF29286.1 hypothetical protein CSH63_17805 [Micromonospora tulbaghiae]